MAILLALGTMFLMNRKTRFIGYLICLYTLDHALKTEFKFGEVERCVNCLVMIQTAILFEVWNFFRKWNTPDK